MKLIVGLGNPGEKYKDNRHNVGFMVVDKLKIRISNFQFPISNEFKIFKSDKFMNNSGEFVEKLIDQYKLDLSNLWIIHDDLDLALGIYKIQFGKGPKIHKGLVSIDKVLGTNSYWHVRIGVENRNPQGRASGEEYVLQDFEKGELLILKKVVTRIIKDLEQKIWK